MPQAFPVWRTHLISVETTIYLFFKHYPVENRLGQRYLKKKRVMYELRGLFI